MDELKFFLTTLNESNIYINAICIQETWLTSDADLCTKQIPGYTSISRGRTCSSKGGLIIYLHEHYSYTIDTSFDNFSDWACQLINVDGGNLRKKLILGNIYRSPRGTIDHYKTLYMSSLIP